MTRPEGAGDRRRVGLRRAPRGRIRRIWEWGYRERVSTGLYTMSLGAHGVGLRFLTSAQRLLGRAA